MLVLLKKNYHHTDIDVIIVMVMKNITWNPFFIMVMKNIKILIGLCNFLCWFSGLIVIELASIDSLCVCVCVFFFFGRCCEFEFQIWDWCCIDLLNMWLSLSFPYHYLILSYLIFFYLFFSFIWSIWWVFKYFL